MVSTTIAAVRATTRSRISNGTRLLENVDGRSSRARRFRDLVNAYSAELGGELSEAERSLVRQAVALQLQAERMQEMIVRGGDNDVVDADQLIRISSTSKRLLSVIAAKSGQRQPVPTGPTLDELFAAPDEAEAEEAVAE
jgi:hypothetical protein